MRRSGLRVLFRVGSEEAGGPRAARGPFATIGRVAAGVVGALALWMAGPAGPAAAGEDPRNDGPRAEDATPAEAETTPQADPGQADARADRVYRLIEEAAEGRIAEPEPLRQKPAQAEDQRAPAAEDGGEGGGLEEDPGDFGYDAPGGWSGYPWAWGWYPWYGVPQTRIIREYPPSITHIPRLGLQYNYPYAYQMGIRIPDDSSPLDHPPTMGPFVGVVQAAKEELRRQEAQARRAASVEDRALAWMRGGEYARAGRLLAKGFESSTDPRYPLLLAEVFFALEKPALAESLLRHALRSKAGVAELPSEIRSHFADPKDFDAKLDALASSGKHGLLAAYLLVTSERFEQGVEWLGKLSADTPEDVAANRLYRHYLSKALAE